MDSSDSAWDLSALLSEMFLLDPALEVTLSFQGDEMAVMLELT